MGISVSAYLVAGVRLSDLARKVTETSTVTKYNQDTGKPYDTEIVVTKIKIGNKTFDQEAGYPEDLIKWPKGLSFVTTGDIGEGDWDSVVVGVKVAEADDYEWPAVVVTDEKIDEAKEKAKNLLEKVGWTDPVGLYLVLYGSA
jgi:hypothetical protein